MWDEEWIGKHSHFIKNHPAWQIQNPEWGKGPSIEWIMRNEDWVKAHPSFLAKRKNDDVRGIWHGGREEKMLQHIF